MILPCHFARAKCRELYIPQSRLVARLVVLQSGPKDYPHSPLMDGANDGSSSNLPDDEATGFHGAALEESYLMIRWAGGENQFPCHC